MSVSREEILQRARNMKVPELVFSFGKYKGKTAAWVLENDPGYIVWAWNTVSRGRLPFKRSVYEDASDRVGWGDYDDLDELDFWAMEIAND
jgi:hypothetical protein